MAISKLDLVLSFTGLCLLNLIAAVDSTALGVSLPTIANPLGATSTQAYWAGSSFVLASSAVQPIYAAFSNAFGRRTLTLIALALFTIGTIVGSTAQNVASLLVGRTLQGAGGGGFLTMTYVVLVDLFTLRKRANAIALIGLVWLVGTVVGPIAGGAFTEYVTWRWIFWICLPFAGMSIFLIAFLLKTPHEPLQLGQALKMVDWAGAVVFTGCLTSFLLAISWGGSMFAWSSYQTLVPLIIGAVGLVAWLFYEHYVPTSPILPLVLLGNRTNLALFTGTIFMGIIQYGLVYYLPLYYQLSKGYSPLMSGVALLPQCVLSGPTTTITSVIISKTGKYRLVIWIGWALLSLGCGLLVLLTNETTVPQWIFLNAVSGLGLGCLFTSQSMATQAASEPQHMAIAAGLSPFFRALGQTIGIVIGDSIFQNTLRQKADEYSNNITQLGAVLDGLPEESQDRADLLAALNPSFHAIWWTLTAFALASLALSLCIPQLSLDQSQPVVPSEEPGNDVERTAESRGVHQEAEIIELQERQGADESV
ncbi:hypothetical protein M409DRAFT_65147 [Zasmidium cellare ATCC 36951]|uniref:Major facilitator superfamily (MFS) profile domain-containing protein n=1 Tax=Zasmidium cellare ATCC 36951 TaxID=1080233 RepID=A0A6A6CNN1_ZASCE|nr:uncharacterized protein M409DRAFT_65147 [Zasmidium cellare ATCC 36951]KAF2168725.1 hypothetical protein M409DRAFT_65147 [Zasmidium cellare ATCC 36951]